VQRYLRSGEEQGLPKRYKCRVREPWFRVPSVHATPVAMLKRAHHFPRLVLNKAQVFTTDTAYRIQPKQVTAASLVYSFLNSLTSLSAELEGRHYGGGVLELVPSEIERLILPVVLHQWSTCKNLMSDSALLPMIVRFWRNRTDLFWAERDCLPMILTHYTMLGTDCEIEDREIRETTPIRQSRLKTEHQHLGFRKEKRVRW
jgi:hypothetical protein